MNDSGGVNNPGASKYSDKATTNIRLPDKVKAEAKRKAKQLGLSLTDYMEKLLHEDLQQPK